MKMARTWSNTPRPSLDTGGCPNLPFLARRRCPLKQGNYISLAGPCYAPFNLTKHTSVSISKYSNAAPSFLINLSSLENTISQKLAIAA